MSDVTKRPRPQSIFSNRKPDYPLRQRIGTLLTISGLAIFMVGAEPDLIGLDRSPVTGFVQITVFLVGLALLSLGGFTALAARWRDTPFTLLADFGFRLISTGYVIALFSGMADIFGFGSEALPRIPRFGFWQSLGVLVGEIVIGLGFLLLIPWRRPQTEPPPAVDETAPVETPAAPAETETEPPSPPADPPIVA